MKVYQVQHIVNDQVRSQFCALKSEAQILARDLDGEVITLLVAENGREELCEMLNDLCTRAELVGASGDRLIEPETDEEPEPDHEFTSWECVTPKDDGTFHRHACTMASSEAEARRSMHHFAGYRGAIIRRVEG